MQPRDERAHGIIEDALNKGYLDSGKPYVVPGFPSHDAANEARQSIARGLHHYGVAPAAWVTDSDGNQCYKNCQDPSAPHGAAFELHSKDRAKKHVVEQTGGDPSKLRFNPYARNAQPRVTPDGQWKPPA